jgi:transposase
MREDNFPRIWERGLSLEEKLFSEQGRAQLEKLSLAPWASRRRQELLELLDRMNPTIEELIAAVAQEARKRPEVLRLMTHPGVSPLTALAYVLIIGTPERFPSGKQIGNYVGMRCNVFEVNTAPIGKTQRRVRTQLADAVPVQP